MNDSRDCHAVLTLALAALSCIVAGQATAQVQPGVYFVESRGRITRVLGNPDQYQAKAWIIKYRRKSSEAVWGQTDPRKTAASAIKQMEKDQQFVRAYHKFMTGRVEDAEAEENSYFRPVGPVALVDPDPGAETKSDIGRKLDQLTEEALSMDALEVLDGVSLKEFVWKPRVGSVLRQYATNLRRMVESVRKLQRSATEVALVDRLRSDLAGFQAELDNLAGGVIAESYINPQGLSFNRAYRDVPSQYHRWIFGAMTVSPYKRKYVYTFNLTMTRNGDLSVQMLGKFLTRYKDRANRGTPESKEVDCYVEWDCSYEATVSRDDMSQVFSDFSSSSGSVSPDDRWGSFLVEKTESATKSAVTVNRLVHKGTILYGDTPQSDYGSRIWLPKVRGESPLLALGLFLEPKEARQLAEILRALSQLRGTGWTRALQRSSLTDQPMSVANIRAVLDAQSRSIDTGGPVIEQYDPNSVTKAGSTTKVVGGGRGSTPEKLSTPNTTQTLDPTVVAAQKLRDWMTKLSIRHESENANGQRELHITKIRIGAGKLKGSTVREKYSAKGKKFLGLESEFELELKHIDDVQTSGNRVYIYTKEPTALKIDTHVTAGTDRDSDSDFVSIYAETEEIAQRFMAFMKEIIHSGELAKIKF